MEAHAHEAGAQEVRAAGGIVWRLGGGGGVEVAVIHRPKYDDWSLPKGKLDAGEGWEEAALREVCEEIGLRCRLGDEVGRVSYTDHRGRPKVVRYWLMEPLEEVARFRPSREVDELRWLGPEAAIALLSHEHDRELVRRALGPMTAEAPKVELLWWAGCPSTPRALEELQAVLGEAGLDPGAIEMREVTSDDDARSAGFVGSPTIRIDGRDVQPPQAEPTGLSCRVYRLRDGRFSPTPDPADVREAVRAATRERRETWRAQRTAG